MRLVGKIDREIYNCITKDIVTDEVIITDERVQHIKERHSGIFETIEPYLHKIIENPDYILEDKNYNTCMILKLIHENGLRFQVVLRIHTFADIPGFYNSIISAWKISKSRWVNYVKNKKILYKRE